MESVVAMVEGVKALGMETCMTLGMLSDRRRLEAQARRPRLLQPQHRYVRELLRQGHHDAIFADRLDTLAQVREAGIKVCSGGIVGMGEEEQDRVDMLVTLANLAEHPGERADQHADPDRGHASR